MSVDKQSICNLQQSMMDDDDTKINEEAVKQILFNDERLVTNQIEEKNRTGRLNLLNSPLGSTERMTTNHA